MTGPWKTAAVVSLGILAILLGIAAVMLVNVAGAPVIEAILPGGLDEDGMPTTTASRVLLKGVIFAAGVAGAVVVVLVAPVRPLLHIWILLGLYLVVDTLAVVALWDRQPLWFTLLILPLVFPQVWVGWHLGMRLRRRLRPGLPVRSAAFEAAER